MKNPATTTGPCPECRSSNTEDAGWVRGEKITECNDCGWTFQDCWHCENTGQASRHPADPNECGFCPA